jgi:hypothetical protein
MDTLKIDSAKKKEKSPHTTTVPLQGMGALKIGSAKKPEICHTCGMFPCSFITAEPSG